MPSITNGLLAFAISSPNSLGEHEGKASALAVSADMDDARTGKE
jgi:hypothetical protein